MATFRLDTSSVLRPVKFLADGGARVDATLTRTGVFTYYDAQGREFREYRPESEVFHPDSIASFEALPVTDDHPPVMVTASNRDQYKRGRVGDSIKRDGIHMVGSLIIDDAKLIAKMRAGKIEVSNGYTCDLDMTPGVTPDGERYDAIQRNIRGNHVAIVDQGRAGSARARMDTVLRFDSSARVAQLEPAADSAANHAAGLEHVDAQGRISAMEELQKKLGEALAAVEQQKARADRAEGERDALKTRADKAEGERDALKTRADKAEGERDNAVKERTDALNSIPKLVKLRSKLNADAEAVLGASIKIDGKDVAIADVEDERALQLAVVQKIDGQNVDVDEAGQKRGDAYVKARYDGAVARTTRPSKLDAARAAVQGSRNDAAPFGASGDDDEAEAKARKKMMKDQSAPWKPGADKDKE